MFQNSSAVRSPLYLIVVFSFAVNDALVTYPQDFLLGFQHVRLHFIAHTILASLSARTAVEPARLLAILHPGSSRRKFQCHCFTIAMSTHSFDSRRTLLPAMIAASDISWGCRCLIAAALMHDFCYCCVLGLLQSMIAVNVCKGA